MEQAGDLCRPAGVAREGDVAPGVAGWAPSRFPESHPVMQVPACWHPDAPRQGYAVLHFRAVFSTPHNLCQRIHVSASQRFILYVDGVQCACGPSRSDPDAWGVVPVELTLAPGAHVLAVTVFHYGAHGGKGQRGGAGFFLLATDTPSAIPDTAGTWRVFHDTGVRPVTERASTSVRGHCAVGAGEEHDLATYPHGWMDAAFDDQTWPVAQTVVPRASNPWGNRPLDCFLRPEPLPPMQNTLTPVGSLRACTPSSLGDAARMWAAGEGTVTIPADTDAEFVLDAGCLVNAYPVLRVSGGAGGVVSVVTCEAAVDPATLRKGNRDEIAGKAFPGLLDRYLPDGGADRVLEPLWFRAFRYLHLRIRTEERPLCLEAITLRRTGYPLHESAQVEIDDPTRPWDAMQTLTHRTACLCAHETLFDCPHYEQAQFPGDARIQARYHYLACNDDRLIRKAIDDMHASRTRFGLLQSHAPSTFFQILPTYSLHWIGMLHDFRVYRGDVDFLAPYLPVARGILDWFARHSREDGLPTRMPFAPFVDWTAGFDCGRAPEGTEGGSSIVSLLFAQACRQLAGLEVRCGYPELAPRWSGMAEASVGCVMRHCHDPARALIADTPERQSYSVHAQTEAVLAGAVPPLHGAQMLLRALGAEGVIQPGTFYYRAFVAEALLSLAHAVPDHKAELHRACVGLLDAWWPLLAGTGLTTWPETCSENPRSDCHGWSVLPGIARVEWFAGVRPDPDADGFARCVFDPVTDACPAIRSVTASIPTPGVTYRVQIHEGDRALQKSCSRTSRAFPSSSRSV